MHILRRILRDELGASAAEYALILAIVGLGTIVAAITLGNAVGTSMNCASESINTQAVGASC